MYWGVSALELATKLAGTCTSTVPGWLRAESGNASVDVTGTDPVKVDVSVVNKGDSEPELICAVPLAGETTVLELGTKPDGT